MVYMCKCEAVMFVRVQRLTEGEIVFCERILLAILASCFYSNRWVLSSIYILTESCIFCLIYDRKL